MVTIDFNTSSVSVRYALVVYAQLLFLDNQYWVSI